MRALLLIAWNDLRILFQDRGIWLNILLIPFFLALASGFANGQSLGPSTPAAPTTTDTPQFRLDAVGAPTSPVGAAFLDAIYAANTNIVVCPQQNTADDFCALGAGAAGGTSLTREQAQARLQDGTTLGFLDFPDDFSDRLQAGDAAAVSYVNDPSLAAPRYLLEAVQAAAQSVGSALRAESVGLLVADSVPSLTFADAADRAAFGQQVRERAAALGQNAPITLISETAARPADADSSSAGDGFGQSIPGMASMYVMFAIFPAAAAFMRERRAWLLQRMVTLPLTRIQILGGRLLARFALGMIQYAVMFLFGLVLGVHYGRDPVALVLLMIAFAFCITALMTLLSTFLRNEGQAQGISLFLTLTLAPLGGAWWPLEIVPPFMQTIGHLSPVSWVMTGFRDLIFYGGSLATVWPNILLLSVTGVVFFAIGVARFQFND